MKIRKAIKKDISQLKKLFPENQKYTAKLVVYKTDKNALSFYKKHKFVPKPSKFINFTKRI